MSILESLVEPAIAQSKRFIRLQRGFAATLAIALAGDQAPLLQAT